MKFAATQNYVTVFLPAGTNKNKTKLQSILIISGKLLHANVLTIDKNRFLTAANIIYHPCLRNECATTNSQI